MTPTTHQFKNAMRVYAAELICSTKVWRFQTFRPVFCMYNKLRLHTEILSLKMTSFSLDPTLCGLISQFWSNGGP